MPDVDLCPLHTTYTHSYTVNSYSDKPSVGINHLPGSCSERDEEDGRDTLFLLTGFCCFGSGLTFLPPRPLQTHLCFLLQLILD